MAQASIRTKVAAARATSSRFFHSRGSMCMPTRIDPTEAARATAPAAFLRSDRFMRLGYGTSPVNDKSVIPNPLVLGPCSRSVPRIRNIK